MTPVGLSVYNPKAIHFQFTSKLSVHLFAAVLPIHLPKTVSELLMELLLSFLFVLLKPCWCLHVLVIFFIYYIPFQLPGIIFFFCFCWFFFFPFFFLPPPPHSPVLCMFSSAILDGLSLCSLIFLISHHMYNFNLLQVVVLSSFTWSTIYQFKWSSMLLLLSHSLNQ